MKKLLIFVLAILIGGAALFIGGNIILFYLNPFSHMKACIITTPSTVSLELAQKSCPITLPNSATNIQYGIWSLWQAHMTFVRFEAPVADCLKHAEKVLNEDAVSYSIKGVSIVESTDFPKPLNPGTPAEKFDVNWFDVEAISNGIQFKLKSEQQYCPSIIVYVDQNRGVFYYQNYD
jgi:hypothetical protein